MKYAFLILTLFNISANASCLVSIDKKNYHAIIWKHTEDQADTVIEQSIESDSLKYLLENKKGLKVVFNDGVFTSMNYMEGETKRWATLTHAEKDMIFYLQEHIDVTEK